MTRAAPAARAREPSVGAGCTDIVISPHFDDAAFSAGHLLATRGAAVTVITVCGGAPADGAVSEWDAECGFASGADAAATRLGEDLRANQVVGARSLRLAVTDEPYRAGFPAGQVVAELTGLLAGSTAAIWVPAGLGSHPDHLATREAALAAASSRGRLRFYADCPYAFAYGWDAADADRDADHRWAGPLARIENYLGTARAHTVRLGAAEMRAKLAMVAAHESQVRVMAAEFSRLLDADGPMRREMYWQ